MKKQPKSPKAVPASTSVTPSKSAASSSSTSAGGIPQLVDHQFRHTAGRLVATLTRLFGPQHLQLAEDVVQEALMQALRQWSYRGVPENPAAWLTQVAKNRALDALRRQSVFHNKAEKLAREVTNALEQDLPDIDDPLGDDQLALMFMCCRPELSREAHIALTLNVVSRFSAAEIAQAFLVPEPTIAQRIVRAKRKLRDIQATFELPPDDVLAERLDSVLSAIYLLFNEGYTAHYAETLTRSDLCTEAVRLVELLVARPAGVQPKAYALAALLLLQASRLHARVDAEGNLCVLAEQDRSRWDQEAIQRGLAYLERATAGQELTEYHLQAGIAACHAVADSYEETDWGAILGFYDQLYAIYPSPVVALNRSVAVAMVDGAAAAIAELEKVQDAPELDGYYLLHATFGELYERLDDPARAAAYYRDALSLTTNEAECQFLERKLENL